VAACSPSKATEPQQAPVNQRHQELAQLAANRFGLCTAGPEDTRNNDGYLLGMLRARHNH
jgi:hypothetical protein